MADIRPMNFGEILDGALMIYRRHFGLFLKLALAALSVPVLLLVYFGLRAVSEVMVNPVRTLLFLFPVGILYYIATLVLTAGTIRIISDSYLGRAPRLQDALALGLSKILPLIAVGLGKAIVLGLIMVGAGVVAGIFGAVLKGSAVGVLLIVTFVCNVLPSQVLQAIANAVMRTAPAAGIVLTVLAVILPLILAPVIAAVITLMYYDLRVRREAFDLQVLGQRLGII